MANGMMAPMAPSNENQQLMQQGIDQGMQKADAMMTEEDVLARYPVISGIERSSTEGDATNFVISKEQFASTIDDQVLQILQTKLTPSMRSALAIILGPEVGELLEGIGLQEPQHLVPQSVIAKAFPAQTVEESIAMFDSQLMNASNTQNDIPSPPTGGLGGAPMMDVPPTNVPPVE
jgi:hypothetical protein